MGMDELKEMQKKLAHQEGKEHGGAPSRSPKQHLLDASEVQKAHPDDRVRWIQTGNAERAQTRIADGYTPIPESEGGRKVGGLSLAKTSRENYERRTAAVKQKNRERLQAHKTEVERAAEAVARELRDQHGIDVDVKRMLVDE